MIEVCQGVPVLADAATCMCSLLDSSRLDWQDPMLLLQMSEKQQILQKSTQITKILRPLPSCGYYINTSVHFAPAIFVLQFSSVNQYYGFGLSLDTRDLNAYVSHAKRTRCYAKTATFPTANFLVWSYGYLRSSTNRKHFHAFVYVVQHDVCRKNKNTNTAFLGCL